MDDKTMRGIYQVGSLFILGLKLQGYFFVKLLMGGIVLGLFPALLGIYRLIHECIEEKSISTINVMKELKRFDKKEFWQINTLGYMFLLLNGILLINFNISRSFIGSWVFHLLLILLMIMVFGASQFIIPIFAKYNLPITQYIYQAFLFFIVNIIETVAIFVGLIAVGIISLSIPIIGVFGGIPLLFFPYVWFAKIGVNKAEAVLYIKEN